MKLRSQFNYDTMEASNEAGLKCEDESLAVQSAKEETDINTIVRRFGLTGELPTNVRAPQYGDFTGIVDYQTALNQVRAAEAAFMEMPAEIRARFQNDPQLFVEFCSNPDNLSEMKKMGLTADTAEVVTEGGVPPTEGATPPVKAGDNA